MNIVESIGRPLDTKPAGGTSIPRSDLDSLTPAMRQYAEQKNRVGDAILLFRMGDFYETFFDDAVLCSKVLGIALTSRDRNSPNPVPLAGIPYHALDNYLAKLVAAGYRVAVSEQIEDPKQAKGVVRRDIVRIVTAGTLTEERLLSDREESVLAALCVRGTEWGLAFVELASGRFEVVDATEESALDELIRVRPAELLIDEMRGGVHERIAEHVRSACGCAIVRRFAHEFGESHCGRVLNEHFQTATLRGFGFEEFTPALCAAGCAIQYLRETQRTSLSHIADLRRRERLDFLQIDHATWRSLEIERTMHGGQKEGSLLHAIDRTVHPLGGRTLRHWLRRPLIDPNSINARLDAVAELVADDLLRRRLRQIVGGLADVERIAGRVALSRCSPRDLHALGSTLHAFPALIEELRGAQSPLLLGALQTLTGMDEIERLLIAAIRSEAGINVREGGFINDGFDAELDRLRSIGRDGQQWLADYQRREVERTGIASLKAGYNRVFGYYLEIPHSQSTKAPAEYVRRQTVKNAERYITEALKNHEHETLTAQERANELEFELFERVRLECAQWVPRFMSAAQTIGTLDCLAGLAELAVERRYIRPEITDGRIFEISDGRHPVLDQILRDDFVPNDLHLSEDDERLLVITGPNMAGKSTYIRQTELLTVLAQIGSFVPASSMRFGVVDRLFARVGSADELARGQSTFMTEMIEAANILHHATDRSLVVLDELGRGTSTFDGLALAWAIAEHLATTTRCRTLMATHYHEMTELAGLIDGVRNYNVAARECPAAGDRPEGVVFLYKIVPGGADKSYGIHVARLAGVPALVVERSRVLLHNLEQSSTRRSSPPEERNRKKTSTPQLSLFSDPAEELYAAFQSIDYNTLSPESAMNFIREQVARMR
ncbi:MAG: DNA mismatch repair protein MutS [Planctomycetes bacterium]|nr:DNA mismatch repair protein MutS [Planctomycetota bacterium]MBI3834907.1 DNA mismatch repair protein MutS [Planctomycetota bacterium]